MKTRIFSCSLALILTQLLTSCSKSPSDPKDFGEKVLQTFVVGDYDAFLELTVTTLSEPQIEGILQDLMEAKLSHFEKKLLETSGEEVKSIVEEIADIRKRLEDKDAIAMDAKGLFMRMNSEDMGFEDWKEEIEEFQKHRIIKLEQEIRDEPQSEGEDYRKEILSELKSESLGSEQFDEWKDRRKRMKEKWRKSFDTIVKEGKTAGINWEDVEFEYVDYDEERITYEDTDILLVFSYREKSYKILLDDCLKTNLGIIMGDDPRWRGSFESK